MEKYLPLSEDEKKKMQPWKTGAVKYPQVSIVRQPCTIAEGTSDPEKCIDPELDINLEGVLAVEDRRPIEKGDGGTLREAKSIIIDIPTIEGQTPGTSKGAHFCFGKPTKKDDSEGRSQAEESKSKEIDQWLDIV